MFEHFLEKKVWGMDSYTARGLQKVLIDKRHIHTDNYTNIGLERVLHRQIFALHHTRQVIDCISHVMVCIHSKLK